MGDIGNDGVHDIDIARWGLGVDMHPSTASRPSEASLSLTTTSSGPIRSMWCSSIRARTAPHMRQLIFEQRIWSPYFQEGHENGNAFYGTKGVMILGKKDGWKVTLAGNKPGPSMQGTFCLPAHHQNFLDCIRDGKTPNADIEIGHQTAGLCHLGNIATRIGRVIRFDPETEEVAGDTAAAAFLRRQYRPGHWAVPRGV